MPFIRVETSSDASCDADGLLIERLAHEVADILEKPIRYVMTAVHRCKMSFSGEEAPAAFTHVMSIGEFQDDVREELVSRVTEIIHDALSVPKESIYVRLEAVSGRDWAWRGKCFR